MRIEIPCLPPRELNPNWKGHWAKKARAVRSFRGAACVCALNDSHFSRPGYNQAEVSITFVIPSRRYIRDPDNALTGIKPGIDGCVDAGVIIGDDDEHLSYRLPIMYEIDKAKAPMTILEFKEVKLWKRRAK